MDTQNVPRVKRQKQRALRKKPGSLNRANERQQKPSPIIKDTTLNLGTEELFEERKLRRLKKGKEVLGKRKCSEIDYEQETNADRRMSKKRFKRRVEMHFSKASTSGSKGVLNEFLGRPTAETSGDEFKPKNEFGMIDIQESVTYYRCNLKSAVRDLRNLTFKPEHMIAIKKTPFWVLFNAIMTKDSKQLRQRCNKFEEDIRSVMKTFDTKSKKFVIGGEFMDISKVDIQLILGVTGGSEPVPLIINNYVYPKWLRRCFNSTEGGRMIAGKKQLYKCFILRMLREVVLLDTQESYEDTARLVHCYLLAMFLAPTRNCSINWHVTCYCEILEAIYLFDWCGFILEQLMSQLQRTKNLLSGGCTMLLVYWLCEKSRLLEPYEDVVIPRCLRWNLKELNIKLRKINIVKMKREYVRNTELNPTSLEKEEYRRLKKLWDAQLAKMKDISLTPESILGVSVKDNSDNDEEYESPSNSDEIGTVPLGDTDELPSFTRNETIKNRRRRSAKQNCQIVCRRSPRINKSGSSNESSKYEKNLTDTFLPVPGDRDIVSKDLKRGRSNNTPTTDHGKVASTVQSESSSKQPTWSVSKHSFHNDENLPGSSARTVARNLDKELGLQGITNSTKESGLDKSKRVFSLGETSKQGGRASKKNVAEVPKKSQHLEIDKPSFSLGIPSTIEEKGTCDNVNMKDLLNDINKSAGINLNCEIDHPLQSAMPVGENERVDARSVSEVGGDEAKLPRTKNCSNFPSSVAKLEQLLAEKDREIQKLIDNLEHHKKEFDAVTSLNEITVQRRLEEAVREASMHNAIVTEKTVQELNSTIEELKRENARLQIFETLSVEKDIIIQSLGREKDVLLQQLKAELDPTESQFLQKETTIKIWAEIEEKEEVKKRNTNLVEENQLLNDKIERMQHVDQGTAIELQLNNSDVKQGTCAKNVIGDCNKEKLEDNDKGQDEEVQKDNSDGDLKDESLRNCGGSGFPETTKYPHRYLEETVAAELFIGDESDIVGVCENNLNSLKENCTPMTAVGRKRRAVTPNTMIRKVKCRTLNGERKRIIGDDEDQIQLIPDSSSDDSEDYEIKDKICQRGCALPLNLKKGPASKLKDNAKFILQARWAKKRASAVVWRGSPVSGNYVTIFDILLVLHDDRLSTSVVDCWGELLLKIYGSSMDTIVFLTTAWDYIHYYDGGNRTKALFNTVDKRIEKELGKDHVLLFPMLTKGRGRHEQGDHWTLLELNLDDCEWRFFNSLEPRSKKIQDIHFQRSLELVNYVEKKIREVFKIKFPDHRIHQCSLKAPFPIYGPQQSTGSLDCGVVLCSNLEKLISRTTITKYKFKHDEAVLYRTKIVEWLVDSNAIESK